MQGENQIKTPLGLIQNNLHNAQTRHDDQMKVVIKSGKDKVKELLDKELSASAALVVNNKAIQLTARFFKVRQAKRAQEEHQEAGPYSKGAGANGASDSRLCTRCCDAHRG